MADKSKNKKDNKEYASDGSVVVYRVDNDKETGKTDNSDGSSTFFVRKVTDERWETNLPDPLWLADKADGGCHAKPPCSAFSIDPFDIVNIMRGGLRGDSDENGYVVIYESDDPNFNDINKFKKGNKMVKTNYFQKGGGMSTAELKKNVKALVAAAIQGNQDAIEQINQIKQAAESGNNADAVAIWNMIQEEYAAQQGASTQSSRNGGKFNYINWLRTGLKENQDVVFNRNGGRLVRRVVDSRKPGGRLVAPTKKYINYFD